MAQVLSVQPVRLMDCNHKRLRLAWWWYSVIIKIFFYILKGTRGHFSSYSVFPSTCYHCFSASTMTSASKWSISHIHCVVQWITCSDNRWEENQSSSILIFVLYWMERYQQNHISEPLPQSYLLSLMFQSLQHWKHICHHGDDQTDNQSAVPQWRQWQRPVRAARMAKFTIRKHSLTDFFQPSWVNSLRGLDK